MVSRLGSIPLTDRLLALSVDPHRIDMARVVDVVVVSDGGVARLGLLSRVIPDRVALREHVHSHDL